MAKKASRTDGVQAFLNAIEDPERRADCKALAKLMKRVTGEAPKLWGPSMVGYGSYHYRYESGREGDWFLTGFAPRKGDLTIYVVAGFDGHATRLKRLGPHKLGKSCLYVKRLADVDEEVLEELIERSVAAMRKRYPAG